MSMVLENLGTKVAEILKGRNGTENCGEWRVLGQEQNGAVLASWVSESCDGQPQTHVGVYQLSASSLEVLYCFDKVVNIIQASTNQSETLLGYVIKEKIITSPHKTAYDGNNKVSSDIDVAQPVASCAGYLEGTSEEFLEVYKPFLVEVKTKQKATPQQLGCERSNQVMIQFLFKKKEQRSTQKFLVLIHQESISLNQVAVKTTGENLWAVEGCVSSESVVRSFSWAQWDPVHQSLYYIHYRKPQLIVEGEEPDLEQEEEVSPTLSCLQFHDELPHETVLNIPLNLPQLPKSAAAPCGAYEDDPVPLRIHDCSLELQILCDPKGIVCICHHYLYQPVKPPAVEPGGVDDPSTTVHFAYSVTLLHHGCVIHCVVPGIVWAQARIIRPTFALHGDQHMVVCAPGLFTHLLDVGLSHEPCCHILMSSNPPGLPPHVSHLVPLLHQGAVLSIDLPSLDLVPLTVSTEHLLETFRNDQSLNNRLAILHYFLVHQLDMDTISELLVPVVEQALDLSVPQLLQEILIGGSYAAVHKNLPSDAMTLVALLPLTTANQVSEVEVKVDRLSMSLSQEMLWNTAMMLLSPQQRLVPYRVDMWTRLWEQLTRKTDRDKLRFRPSQVAEKLMISLVCYQPEALSRSSTPLSPSTSLVSSGTLADLASIAGSRKGGGIGDSLPFYEVESCTASKQEHVISVNLRELSMHLLKNSNKQTPMHVHVVATRYVAAQLEMSRLLCSMLCQCVAVDPRLEHERGFALVDQLDEGRQHALFIVLERYYFAVDSLAFPIPQGFTSFFTFLGYRALSFSMFLQYLQRNVFELQVDVMKVIMADTEESADGVKKKLRLLLQLPRSRAKRLLNQWPHPVSLMMRAREHALNILSGVEGMQARGHPSQRARSVQLSRGLAAFPSADRLSPLDTFLDLLTAKASLTELDFGLLIEATITSTEEFLA